MDDRKVDIMMSRSITRVIRRNAHSFVPQAGDDLAMILIILSLVAGLIARYPFAVAARSLSSFR